MTTLTSPAGNHTSLANGVNDTLTMIGRSIRLTRRNVETLLMSVAYDLEHGMIDRLRSMPIRSFAVLTGHVTASLARNSVATAIVFATAIAMGFRPNANALGWLLAVGLLALYILAFSWLAAAIGVAARGVESAGASTFFMMFLPYLSSAFVPTDTMPFVLRVISEHQPLTPVIETVRGLLTGTPIGSSGWAALAWSLGLLVAAFTWANWLYRRRISR
jgi:ABC-2 type transport system permease protein